MDTTENTPLEDGETAQQPSVPGGEEGAPAAEPHQSHGPQPESVGAAEASLPAADQPAITDETAIEEQPTVATSAPLPMDGAGESPPLAAAAGNLAQRRATAAPLPADDESTWVSRPLEMTPERLREMTEERRFLRRRRRYALFVRRTARQRRSRRQAVLRRVVGVSTVVLALLIVTMVSATFAAAASYYQAEQHAIHNLSRSVASQDSMRIYDTNGTLLYELRNNGFQHSISISHIPIDVVNATVAIEDHDFWTNDGIDFTSIVRAALENFQQGQVTQGGSTITQQLVKAQLLKDNTTDYARKLREAILSVGITSQGVYSKSEVLELYLNSIGYSPTSYGIDAAAQYYFNYSDDPTTGMTAAQHLDLAQASILAGVPQNPNLNDPLNNFDQARKRQALVLNAMVQYGYITRTQAEQAWEEAAKPNFFHPQNTEQNLAPHFVYYVLRQLQSMIDLGQLQNLSRSGLNIYTTLDLGLNNQVQKIIKQHISSCTEPTGYSGYVMCEAHASNGAGVIADQHTGAIKVLVGSADYNSKKINGQFDVATLGYRGPGSSMKPIVYATAFQKGWFPAMTISDTPTAFWDAGAGTAYKPLNYTADEFAGEITLRRALQWSLNIPAVKVMQFAGVNDVRTNAMRWGLHPNPKSVWGLSSVLGTIEVHPIDMVQVYSVFANGGQYIPLHAIDSISDSAGNVIYQYHVPQPVQVMDPRVAFLITNVLSDNAARAQDFGSCSFLYLDPANDGNNQFTPECNYIRSHGFKSPRGYPAAAKTGTGSNFRDDWTMGYTRDLTMGVWVGNNDDSEMVHVDGIHGAAPIWNRSMVAAIQRYNLKPHNCNTVLPGDCLLVNPSNNQPPLGVK
ncbi:MAG TPA: transglycosylase domain-containing protein, partial [Ktedonobacterales bacterium]|nr:transglycosylase domain-containing protein [Ktedonobacterales bacterium]